MERNMKRMKAFAIRMITVVTVTIIAIMLSCIETNALSFSLEYLDDGTGAVYDEEKHCYVDMDTYHAAYGYFYNQELGAYVYVTSTRTYECDCITCKYAAAGHKIVVPNENADGDSVDYENTDEEIDDDEDCDAEDADEEVDENESGDIDAEEACEFIMENTEANDIAEEDAPIEKTDTETATDDNTSVNPAETGEDMTFGANEKEDVISETNSVTGTEENSVANNDYVKSSEKAASYETDAQYASNEESDKNVTVDSDNKKYEVPNTNNNIILNESVVLESAREKTERVIAEGMHERYPDLASENNIHTSDNGTDVSRQLSSHPQTGDENDLGVIFALTATMIMAASLGVVMLRRRIAEVQDVQHDIA